MGYILIIHLLFWFLTWDFSYRDSVIMVILSFLWVWFSNISTRYLTSCIKIDIFAVVVVVQGWFCYGFHDFQFQFIWEPFSQLTCAHISYISSSENNTFFRFVLAWLTSFFFLALNLAYSSHCSMIHFLYPFCTGLLLNISWLHLSHLFGFISFSNLSNCWLYWQTGVL